MKHRLLQFLLAALLIAAGSSWSIAQAPSPALGDCGSVVSGSWDSTSTWKLYSSHGAFDSTAVAPSSSKNAFVQTGTTVTYMTSSQNCKNLVIQSGGTLRSNITLPASAMYLKINGSTVWVDGNFGAGPNDALSLETKYDGTMTLSGGGTVNIAQLRPNSGQSGTMTFVFATNANINYAGSAGNGGAGIYTTRGTQTSSTITINPGVTVTFAPGSYFELTSSTSSLGAMNTTLNVNGTLHAPSSSVILADSAAYACALNIGSSGIVNVGKNLTPYLTGGGVPSINVASGGALNIVSGGTADFTNPSAKVVGAGSFALQAGATIKIGAPAGLDAAAGPVQTATAKFDSASSYSYVGTGAQKLGAMLPRIVNNLTIASTSVDTLSSSTRVKGLLRIDGALLNNGGVMSVDSALVSGALTIMSGGTADFTNPIAKVTGTGSFALQGGGTINIGASAGLDTLAGPVRTATATFDTAANYNYVGIGLQQLGVMLPDSINNLGIGASSIDSISAAKKVKGVLRIDGLLINNGGLTTVDTAVVYGTYQHNTTTGAMPIAVWKTGSLCLLSAPNTTNTAGIPNGNQNFFNYKVDAPTHSGVARLGFDGNTIGGNLIIHNTNDVPGTSGNYIAIAPKLGSLPVVVMGDLLIDSTVAQLSIGSGSTVTKQTLDVHGNIISKGRFYLNGSGVQNKVFAHGDILIQSVLDDAFRGHSSAANADTVWFAGTRTQRFTKPLAIDMDNLQFVALSGSTVYLDDTTIVNDSGSLPGTFTLQPGATLKLGHANGLNGNLACTGTVNLSRSANYEFCGKSAQTTGARLPGVVNNLIINDSLGVMLSATDTVNGTLTLTRGILSTGSQMVVIGSAGSLSRATGYLNGNLQKQFTSTGSKDFEVGTANGYSPVTVNVTAGSGAMTVAAVQGQHPNTFDATKTLDRYWTLTADPGITKADLRFSYLASDVHGKESAYGAWRHSGTGVSWTALPSFNHVPEHYVTTAGVTSFSDWMLGESSLATSVESPSDNTIPKTFYVDQNYPNPFNPTTRISYGLPDAAYVTAKVYNMLGQEVATITAGEEVAGVHTLSFDASHLSSGVYLYRIQAGKSVEIKRMLLLK